MKVWYLKYSDTPNPRGIPGARPAEYSYDEQRSPWVETDVAGLEAALASTDAAWNTWRAANPVDSTLPAGTFTGEDNTRWKIDRNGNTVPA